MMFLRTLIIACFFVPLSALAQGDVTLRMDFFYGSVKVAEVTDTLLLSEDKQHYRLESKALAVGLAKVLHGDSFFTSSGRVDEQHGLLMTLYSQQRGSREPQQASFGDDGQLQLQRGDEQRSETLTEPLFDYLTAIYRSYIIGKAAAGNIKFTNGWRLTDYEYIVQGEESVATEMGDIDAVLITRTSERGERKIWLAPSLDYLPVRLYVNDKGHEFTTVLKEIAR